jgi:hypothetical protein
MKKENLLPWLLAAAAVLAGGVVAIEKGWHPMLCKILSAILLIVIISLARKYTFRDL